MTSKLLHRLLVSFPALLVALLTGWILIPVSFSQASLTLEQLLESLKSGKPSQAELVRGIAQDGIRFPVNASTLERLASAGATQELLQAVETHAGTSSATTQNAADVVVFSGEATTGEEGPVTREHIVVVLKNNGDQALLAGIVTQYGIAFPYTPAIGREFQQAGANAALLATIATATVGSPSMPEGFATLPLAKAKDYSGSPAIGRLDIRLYVDGAVELRIQGGTVLYKTLQAQPVRDTGSETTGDLPLAPFSKFEVIKRDGRGSFVVMQSPTLENEFQTVIRVYDPKGGEDRYHLRIDWEAR